jgi:hypothetical protein
MLGRTTNLALVCISLGGISMASWACGNTDNPKKTTTSSASTGAGGAGGCAADEHAGSDGNCDTTIAWAKGPSIDLARDHHLTFIADPGPTASRFLYVAGGFSQASNALLDSVVRCPLADDGSLGAWEDAGKLMTATSGNGVVVTHGEVIIAGGFQSSSSWTAPIAADGSLGAWALGPKLGGVRFHTTAVTSGDWVYVIGGLNGNVTTDEVARTTIGADGSLSDWQVIAHLPYSLSHHVSFLDGTTLYVVGGQTGNTNDNSGKPHTETLIATIQSDGSLSDWSMGPPLPQAYETSASMVHDGFAYVVGGILDKTSNEAGGVATKNVVRARITGPGELDGWAVDAGSALPIARSHVHQTPVFGDHVYSVAGMMGIGDTTEVDVGTFQ